MLFYTRVLETHRPLSLLVNRTFRFLPFGEWPRLFFITCPLIFLLVQSEVFAAVVPKQRLDVCEAQFFFALVNYLSAARHFALSPSGLEGLSEYTLLACGTIFITIFFALSMSFPANSLKTFLFACCFFFRGGLTHKVPSSRTKRPRLSPLLYERRVRSCIFSAVCPQEQSPLMCAPTGRLPSPKSILIFFFQTVLSGGDASPFPSYHRPLFLREQSFCRKDIPPDAPPKMSLLRRRPPLMFVLLRFAANDDPPSRFLLRKKFLDSLFF